MSNNWVRRIKVIGSQGYPWTVAISDTGTWGCSCPKWRFARKDPGTGMRPHCHHISGVQSAMPQWTASVAPVTKAPKKPARPAAKRPVLAPELDLIEVRAISALAPGSRFRHLDFDMTVEL